MGLLDQSSTIHVLDPGVNQHVMQTCKQNLWQGTVAHAGSTFRMPAISQGLTCHELLGVVHDGAEEACEGELQVVVQIVLEVNGQVVLQRIDGVLRLVIRLHSLGSLHPEQAFCAKMSELHSPFKHVKDSHVLPIASAQTDFQRPLGLLPCRVPFFH